MMSSMSVAAFCAIVALSILSSAAQTQSPDNEHICAHENHDCVCTGFVRYGYGSTFTPPTRVNGSIHCSNTVFGDPLVGTRKECRCSGTGIFGITLKVFPSTHNDWATRPVCNSQRGDACCACTLTSTHDMCSNATGCLGSAGNGGTASGYTCETCPCKNPGVGCMLPRCTSSAYQQVLTAPNTCTQVGNLNVYAVGACSSTYNASLSPICPRPDTFLYNHRPPYPGTSTSQFVNYCNYMASPACAPQFCTSTYASRCQQQCIALGASGLNAVFNVTSSMSPPPPSRPPSPPGPPAPSSACVTTAGGLCFTDGPGYYQNNERCVISVLQTTTLKVLQFQTESGFDVLRVGSQSFSGTHSPNNLTVSPGTTISWSSDSSVTTGGFIICATVPSTPPPPGTAAGEVQFFSSSTCANGTQISPVPLPVGARESTCQYAPFQDSALYPIQTTCGVPQPTPAPPGSCPGTPVCSNNGLCNMSSHTCLCNPGFGGLSCSSYVCPYNCAGYNASAPARGRCLAPDSTSSQPYCQCNSSFYGVSCGGVLRSIAYTVNHSYSLSGFKTLLAASPNTMRLLNGSGNYTLFAPSNAAINSLPSTVTRYLLNSANTAVLDDVLSYHVVQGLPPAYELTTGSYPTLLQPDGSITLSTSPATVFTLINASNNSGCAVTSFVTASGTHQCITEGAGRYQNNERCAFSVSTTVQLSTPDGFQTEQNFDVLTLVSSSGYSRTFSGTTGPSGQYAIAGSTITWRSDFSVTFNGFLVCAQTIPLATSITTNAQSLVTVPQCTSMYASCNRALLNGYIRPINGVLLPHQIVSMLPSAAPTTAAPSRPPALPPTGRCTMSCDTSTTYCGASNTCVCLPGYARTSPTSCHFVGTTQGPLTTINQQQLLIDATQHAQPIACGDTVRGNTTGGQNIAGNSGADILYRFYVTPSTPQPVYFTTCDPYTNFDTYLRIYAQELNTTSGQYQFVQIAQNDDDRFFCTSGLLSSNVSVPLVPGVAYYILVEGYSTRNGAFALHTQCNSGPPPPPANSTHVQCVRTRAMSNNQPIGPYYYSYRVCCLPGATNCVRSSCPSHTACNPFVGCLPSYCHCGTSAHPSAVATQCSTDTCYNTSKYGLCGVPLTPPPTPAPTQPLCQNGNNGCDAQSTYCGVYGTPSQPRCICRTGYIPRNNLPGNVLPVGETSCIPAPTTTTITSTTTTVNTAGLLQQAYNRAPTISCGANYTRHSVNSSIVGHTGGDSFFRLYVGSQTPQPITLTTCNPHTTFDTVLSIYHQQQDTASNTYRFTTVATNDDMYPRCVGGTTLASSITQSLPSGGYLINVEGYSSSSTGTFTLAVECGSNFGPTPPPSPAPPAPLACTHTGTSQWSYHLCTLYGGSSSSLPCPSGSVCTRVAQSTQCIPISCGCNPVTGAISSCDSTDCRSHSSWGVCLPATPAPTTPAPTYPRNCPSNNPCISTSTTCVMIPTAPPGADPTPSGMVCQCKPYFVRRPGGSPYSCIPVAQSTSAVTTIPITTDPYIANPQLWKNAVSAMCGSTTIGGVSTAQTSVTFYRTTVSANTGLQLTISVCASSGIAQDGFNVFIEDGLSTPPSHTVYMSANKSNAKGCVRHTSDGTPISGLNVSVSATVSPGNYFVHLPNSYALGSGLGYKYTVACGSPALTYGVPAAHTSGWKSLSNGDKTAVLVACVSVIVVIGVVVAAVFAVKRIQSKAAYNAAMLAREMGTGEEEDDTLLRLNQEGTPYEDDFDQSSPETYGET